MRLEATDPGLVSVIIPAFNAESYLEETLASVSAQTYPNIEVIIVNDGSEDSSSALLERLIRGLMVPVQLINQENRGVSAARNRGVGLAKGEYLSFLDADDVWMPDKLNRQVNALQELPHLIGVMCAYSLFDSSRGRIVGEVHPSSSEAYFRKWLALQGPGPLLSSTLLMTRSAWDKVEKFNESLSTAADVDFGMRLRRAGALNVIDEVLVQYRLSESQMHRNPDALERDYTIIMHADYLLSDRALLAKTNANLSLHLGYKEWLAEKSAKTFLSLGLICLRHPKQALDRVFRRMQGSHPFADSGEW